MMRWVFQALGKDRDCKTISLTCYNNFSKTDSEKKKKKYMIETQSMMLKIHVINVPIYICHQIPDEFKVQK